MTRQKYFLVPDFSKAFFGSSGHHPTGHAISTGHQSCFHCPWRGTKVLFAFHSMLYVLYLAARETPSTFYLLFSLLMLYTLKKPFCDTGQRISIMYVWCWLASKGIYNELERGA